MSESTMDFVTDFDTKCAQDDTSEYCVALRDEPVAPEPVDSMVNRKRRSTENSNALFRFHIKIL